jgi:ACS family glucarate transporter-like MFS transporter
MAKQFPYRYRVLILLFFFILITYLDRVCISLVGVRIKTEFHLSNQQFGWVVGAFALAYALFEIPTGILGDRIGQRTVFIRIVLWWSLFTALTGATTGLFTLMVTRFLFGMGEAGAFPNGTGTIARWFPFNETGRGTSALIIGSNVGAAVAPLIIVPIAAAYGWRMPFFINAMIGIAWVLVCFLWFRNHPAEMKKMPAEEKKLIEDNRRFTQDRVPLSWKDVVRNRSLLALVSSFFCSQWGLYFFVAWLPVYLQQGRHFSENAMKTTTSLLFIVGIIGGILAGFFVDRLVKKKGLKAGRRMIGTVSLAMMGFMFLITAATTNDTAASACLMGGYFFMPVYLVNATAVCVDIGRSRACTVVGIMNFAGQLGAFFLAILFGKMADALNSFNAPLLVVAAVLGAGSLIWMAVDPTKQILTEKTNVSRVIAARENLILLK